MDRIDLHNQLIDILGNKNVYFNPPETLKMNYPCIRYSLNGIRKDSADNVTYLKRKSYTIILIHKDPDNKIVDDILDMELCSFERSYVSNNLYHFMFTKFL